MSQSAAIWHDVECGSYAADLALWGELAGCAGGSVVELGCGTGRVALHLARKGHPVVGVDRERELVEALRERAGDLPLRALCVDARQFALEEPAALVLAPMQFVQLLPSAAALSACLRRISASLRPGGTLAAAIVERIGPSEGAPPPIPDVREVDGWVYSSLPVGIGTCDGRILLRRLRQTVSPAGELSESRDEVRLRALSSEQLVRAGERAGLVDAGRDAIASTDLHVGSTVVYLRRAA